MFWSKATIESKEFQILFAKFENLRIEVESVKIELALYKNKLSRKAGIMREKEENQESEKNKNPSIFLKPDGTAI
jgi:hypothetical protein